MDITSDAARRLRVLQDRLGSTRGGLRFEGYIGTCKGSSPVLKPASAPESGQDEVVVKGIRFFVPPDQRAVFAAARLDFESGLMGRGLHMTWAHRDGCACDCGGSDA